MAEVIFDGIKGYGLLHSSQFVSAAVIEATRLGLTSIREYFELRFKKVQHCFNIKSQKAIKAKKLKSSPEFPDYGVQRTKIWAPESEIKKELFDKDKALQPMKLEYLDMPYLFQQTHIGFKFLYALVECPDMELFGL